MEKGYRFRIYPTMKQEIQIKKTFGCTRFVYNHYLAKRRELYKTEKITFGYKKCSDDLTKLKKELMWLKEVDSIAVQASCEHLQDAYDNYFEARKRGDKKWRLPVFKSKKDNEKSYTTKTTNGNIQLFDKHIKLPKLGLVQCRISKQVSGRILSVTVSQVPSGKYYVSVCCTDVEIPQYEPTGAVVGIDLGLKSIAITSDEVDYPNNKYLKKSHKKLAKAQRQHSRKQIGSRNREKARIKVARIHEKVANRRNDSIHNMTTEIVKNYDIICIEDLAVKNMTKNHKLARAISDAAWGEIRRQLTYKAQWQHKELMVIDRFFPSSQLCQCGYKNSAVKDLSVRYWTCPKCGCEHDRDINAAVNILKEGLRLMEIKQAS